MIWTHKSTFSSRITHFKGREAACGGGGRVAVISSTQACLDRDGRGEIVIDLGKEKV